jgi:hypothetical protein
MRMQGWGMRTGISITLPTSDRFRLEDLVVNRNTAQNYVWRTTNVPERRANDVAECKSRVVAVQEVSQLPRVLPG